jgi:NAD(P)-dependent dehydrogenase (short-subunit alcohol dehydrogenase family)
MSTQKNRMAFITGGNRGIGLQTARDLGQLGIEVILGVRDPEDTSALRTLLAEGIAAEAIHYDTAKPETDQAAFAYLERRFGKLGGPAAPMEIADSAKTSVRLATLGVDGPSGGFFHAGDSLPW